MALDNSLKLGKGTIVKTSPGLRIGIAVAVLAVLGLLIFLFNQFNANKAEESKDAKKAHEPAPVTIAQAKLETLPLEIRNVGNVEAFSVVNVIAQVGGQLTDVFFKQGQYIKKAICSFKSTPALTKHYWLRQKLM